MRRTKIKMQMLDKKIIPMYKHGIGCRTIGKILEERSATVFRRVKKLGILRTPKQSISPPRKERLPFSTRAKNDKLRSAAIGIASKWFLERDHTASVPLVTAQYDLVVDSYDGLKRIQVKTTGEIYRGRSVVRIGRRVYDTKVKANAAGRRKVVAYSKSDIDYFFVITNGGNSYLIPIDVVEGKITIVLDDKYKDFLI